MENICSAIADTTGTGNIEDTTSYEGEHSERVILIPAFIPTYCGIQCACAANSPSTKPML
jgi:hypothetical protein